jgi:hypothetical protein
MKVKGESIKGNVWSVFCAQDRSSRYQIFLTCLLSDGYRTHVKLLAGVVVQFNGFAFPWKSLEPAERNTTFQLRTMVRSVLRRNVMLSQRMQSCSIATRLRPTKAAAERDARRVLRPSASAPVRFCLKACSKMLNMLGQRECAPCKQAHEC